MLMKVEADKRRILADDKGPAMLKRLVFWKGW